jgi:hypothetical protein
MFSATSRRDSLWSRSLRRWPNPLDSGRQPTSWPRCACAKRGSAPSSSLGCSISSPSEVWRGWQTPGRWRSPRIRCALRVFEKSKCRTAGMIRNLPMLGYRVEFLVNPNEPSTSTRFSTLRLHPQSWVLSRSAPWSKFAQNDGSPADESGTP